MDHRHSYGLGCSSGTLDIRIESVEIEKPFADAWVGGRVAPAFRVRLQMQRSAYINPSRIMERINWGNALVLTRVNKLTPKWARQAKT